jgi:adenosylhomocysteine nucleosidase
MSNALSPTPSSKARAEAQVLVCFAVREEAQFLRVPNRVVTDTLITGIGVSNASKALSSYLSLHKPRLVLTCGFAGGLNPAHPLGQVLLDAQEGGEFRVKVMNSGALAGRFAHSDRVVVTAGEKAELFEATGADAVEMESSVIVSICRDHGIPVIVLRVISDTATEDLPLDFNRYSTADGGLSMPRLLLGIAGSPSSIPKLMKFQGRLKHASDKLGAALHHVLSACDPL